MRGGNTGIPCPGGTCFHAVPNAQFEGGKGRGTISCRPPARFQRRGPGPAAACLRFPSGGHSAAPEMQDLQGCPANCHKPGWSAFFTAYTLRRSGVVFEIYRLFESIGRRADAPRGGLNHSNREKNIFIPHRLSRDACRGGPSLLRRHGGGGADCGRRHDHGGCRLRGLVQVG